MANSEDKNNEKDDKKGRGWHGDEEGHRNAGRLGGLARARNRKEKESKE
jgi:hypothetical protein